VVQIGVDEMNLRKGQEYLTAFADLLERRDGEEGLHDLHGVY